MRGFFGVGVWHSKTEANVGTLMRSARAYGAAFVYTVGRRYTWQASDTSSTGRHVPLYHYRDMQDLIDHLPDDCPLVGVELHENATPLRDFRHPERACYLLGAEDHGLRPEALARCHRLVEVGGADHCLNVAVAGSIVMYDRVVKRKELFG